MVSLLAARASRACLLRFGARSTMSVGVLSACLGWFGGAADSGGDRERFGMPYKGPRSIALQRTEMSRAFLFSTIIITQIVHLYNVVVHTEFKK